MMTVPTQFYHCQGPKMRLNEKDIHSFDLSLKFVHSPILDLWGVVVFDNIVCFANYSVQNLQICKRFYPDLWEDNKGCLSSESHFSWNKCSPIRIRVKISTWKWTTVCSIKRIIRKPMPTVNWTELIMTMLFIGVVNDGDNEGHDDDNDDHDGEGNGDDIEERNLCNWIFAFCSFHNRFKHLLNLGRKNIEGHQTKHKASKYCRL